MISLFMEHLQLISCGISVIMGRAAVTTGQPGTERAHLGRREGGEAVPQDAGDHELVFAPRRASWVFAPRRAIPFRGRAGLYG